jgi:hypothetical protein
LGTRKFSGVSSSPATRIAKTKRSWVLEVVVGNILKFKSMIADNGVIPTGAIPLLTGG